MGAVPRLPKFTHNIENMKMLSSDPCVLNLSIHLSIHEELYIIYKNYHISININFDM